MVKLEKGLTSFKNTSPLTYVSYIRRKYSMPQFTSAVFFFSLTVRK